MPLNESMASKYKRATMNVSIDPELKALIRKVPKYDRPTRSAYVVNLIVADLHKRGLLPKA